MIQVQYCGYQAHNPDHDTIYRPSGTASYLFLLLFSPMYFKFQDSESPIRAAPGAVILYPPGACQHYWAEQSFVNDYVHFFCEPGLVEQYDIPSCTIYYPSSTEDISLMIQNIYFEYIDTLPCSDQMIDMYVRQLLILMHRKRMKDKNPAASAHPSLYAEFMSVRSNMLRKCHLQWNIETLCGILNLGKSQFYSYYRKFFNSSPTEELIHARLQRACYLLATDESAIQQIAVQSGFQNINYFNRLFQKEFGCSPTEYRKSRSII